MKSEKSKADAVPVTVVVSYFGEVADIVRRRQKTAREEIVLRQGATAADLLDELATRHGRELHEALFVGRDLLPNLIVQVDGSNIAHQQGLATTLRPGAQVLILAMPPLIDGG